jgi:hypothetical protein
MALPVLGTWWIQAMLLGPTPWSLTTGDPVALLEERGFVVIAQGIGTTGRWSSYHGRTMDSAAYRKLPRFHERRVSYGGREVPSPGGWRGLHFDEGVLAIRTDEDSLCVAVVSTLDPRSWSARVAGAPIGQGDLFLDVATQEQDVRHFVALVAMPDLASREHGGRWEPAHTLRSGGTAAPGDVLEVQREAELLPCGGNHGHERGSTAPAGLDERVFARAGTFMARGLFHVEEIPRISGRKRMPNWFLCSWRIPLAGLGLSRGQTAEIALHIAPTCGNDQIGGRLAIGRPSIN